jgi:hypothetical protein
MIDLYDCEGTKWPVETARAMKIWKTQKQVSHIFTARWKTGVRKKRSRQFPTASTRPYYWFLFFTLFQKGTIPQPWVGETKVLIVVGENNS